MCCQPLPPSLSSSPSVKLMIMALKEYGYQSRRGIRVPKKLRSSYSGDVILKKSGQSGTLVRQGSAFNRDCERGSPSVDDLRRQLKPARVRLAMPGPCQCDPGLSYQVRFSFLYIRMGTIRDIKSKLNQKALDALCIKYHIPSCVHPSLPSSNKNILHSPDGKIGVYTQFFDFANYRLPLSQFLMDVLDHFRIHLSQISYAKGWMSFIKRSDAAPVCHSKPLDSVKNWNDHFFWVDSMAFPLSVSLKSKILSKDPHLNFLDMMRRRASFYGLIPLRSRNFQNHSCVGLVLAVTIRWMRTLIQHFGMVKRVEMDLFVFILHYDPTKVRVGERNLADMEVKLLKMIEGRTVALDPPATAASRGSGDSIDKLFDEEHDVGHKHSVENDDDALEEKLRGDHQSLPPNTSGKSLATLRGMIPEGSDLPSGTTEPLIVASQAPIPNVGPVDSVFGLNLRTHHPHVRYVVSSKSSYHSDSYSYSEATSFARSLVADALVVTVVVTTIVDADVAAGSKVKDTPKDFEDIRDYASAGRVESDSMLDDPYTCRDLTDHLAPPAMSAQLRAMDYDQLYSEFNVGVARQVCLGAAEVRMRAEHTLEKKESEAAEAISLRSQLSIVEAADATKSTELRDLMEKNFALEGERNILSEKVATLESVTTSKEDELASLSSQVAKLTANLSGLQLSRDELNSKVASLEFERDCLASQKSSLESDVAFIDYYSRAEVDP
ncbi:hypothetical protein Tco_0633275 [Tanacetum coccineum]